MTDSVELPPPLYTLDALAAHGVAWVLSFDTSQRPYLFELCYRNTQHEHDYHTYTVQQLTEIDPRLPDTLTRLERVTLSPEDLQHALNLTLHLWTAPPPALESLGHTYRIQKFGSVKQTAPGKVNVSFSYYHLVDDAPVLMASGSTPIALAREIALAELESSFPGFTQVLNVAQGLDLSPREAAAYCTDMCISNRTDKVDSLPLPDNVTLET